MDIAHYISDLLNEHDEVGLQGIGTFAKKRVPAYIDETSGLVYPPSVRIEFTEKETADPLIIEHIVRTKNISESSASYFLERFVDNLNKSLDKDAVTDIAPLGELRKNGNELTFQPSGNYGGMEYYGLNPVSIPAAISKPAPLTETTEQASEIDTAVAELEETEDTFASGRSSGSKALWITLTILLLLAALAAAIYFFNPQYLNKFRKAPANKPQNKTAAPAVTKPQTMKDSLTFADSIASELERSGLEGSTVEKAPDSVSISSQQNVADTLKAKPAKVYEIIVASFALRKEALASVKGLRTRGIDAKVVLDTKKPKYKVSIGTFGTKAAADKEHQRIVQQLTRDAWILTVTNKEN